MEIGPLTAESILCHLRRYRFNNRNIGEIANLIDHVEKYGCENKAEQQRVTEELMRLLVPAFEASNRMDTESCVGCVIWMTHLQLQQKLPLLSEPLFDKVLKWIGTSLATYGDCMELVSRICIALDGLFATHFLNANRYFGSITSDVLKYLEWDSTIFVIVNAMRCLDSILNAVSAEITMKYLDISAKLGEKILYFFYCDDKPFVELDLIPNFLLHALQLVNRVALVNAEFASKNISELLGLAKVHFHFGVDNLVTSILAPQRIHVSQQALYDSAEEYNVNVNLEKTRISGGKIVKSRKPRLGAPTGDRNLTNKSPEIKNQLLAFEVKTSDSDMSEPESGENRVLFERNKIAKIRISSITLVGTIARVVERRLIYGYWHGLFPSSKGENADNLLYIGQHDPNMRCRCAALQVCSQLFYGSRGFLLQAETDAKRCPTTFMPFSVSLGLTILTIFKELTTILSTESSLPVLTQALKCLAVLVQAAPFQKLQTGFVPQIVKHVRLFVFHRDVAIQVSALMVMEFLLSASDAEAEIAEAVGLSQEIDATSSTMFNPVGDEELDIEEHEVTDSEEICAAELTEQSTKTRKQTRCPWLLIRVLNNLGNHNKPIATSVLIESLQVLIALSSHFPMLGAHIKKVCEVLKHAMENPVTDVRVHASRCIESYAHQISCFLQKSQSLSAEETKKCSLFWSDIMPIIFDHIRQDKEELPAIRIALCDALSNIGAVMYENCPHLLQMRLLSFLSGVSSDGTEDIVIRAASARALAVYVLYPSLRGDYVFVENTAELTLGLLSGNNLLVRVKSCWSLGNISDVLLTGISTYSRDSQERISEDLLFRMIAASASACSDNDKVRCNAVRALGNLLRLITDDHFLSEQANRNWKQMFEKAICKLTDCLRSSGNAKVKWNTCYAISNILRNPTIFNSTDLNWQKTLYSALCNVIVHHTNFKVRINATTAISSIAERSHFGKYFEQFWSSVLEAIEQSYNLDSYLEYNHRDNLQNQLCLALANILKCAVKDDWIMLKNRLSPHVDTIQNTWKRVVLRMVPEKADSLVSCPVILTERSRGEDITFDEKNAINFLAHIFNLIY